MSERIVDHPLHTPVIRGPLTRNLPLILDEVVDEIQSAFFDTIDSKLEGQGK